MLRSTASARTSRRRASTSTRSRRSRSTSSGSNVLGFLNLFSGGSLPRFAIFALGIMPYITASIILQLMQVVVPSLEKLRKEGEVGQQKITQYTRYLTVAWRWPSPIGYVFLFRSFSSGTGAAVVEDYTFGRVFVIVVTLTAGCVLIMWLGELITQRGIGNGISLMIFASIVSGLPQGIQKWWTNPDQIFQVMMPFMAIGDHRRHRLHPGGPAQDPDPVRQTRGRPANGRRRLHLPAAAREHGRRDPGDLRGLADGLPAHRSASCRRPAGPGLLHLLQPERWPYLVGESFLIVVFTYFYTAVTFNPVEQADNLKKYGGFIPGVRPGRPTAEYLDRILARLTFPGALYLAAVAALPTILINQTSANFYFGGTSILIVVGVALDTMKQLEAQLMMRNYEGFLK